MRKHRIVPLFALLIVAGCQAGETGGSDAATQQDPDGAVSGPDATLPLDAELPADSAVSPDAASGNGCGLPISGNEFTWSVTVDGLQRSFRVHLPSGYDPSTPTPVVLNFHGRNSNADQQMWISGLTDLADDEGFVAVHPEGVGGTWNAGLCCGQAMDQDIDDVGFTAALLDRLEASLCIDPKRVYATGLSNGGFMAHHLGCELAGRIAAFTAVAGPNATPSCTPSRAVPVLHFHGTGDTIVPYDGFAGQLAVPSTMQGWVARNGCGSESSVFFQQDEVTCEQWTGCQDGATVQLCTIDGGGHQWPGGFTIPGLGYNTDVISASQMSWAFFVDHPLP